jgi:hypothetical protein
MVESEGTGATRELECWSVGEYTKRVWGGFVEEDGVRVCEQNAAVAVDVKG